MDAHRMYVCAGGGEGPRSGAQSSGLEKSFYIKYEPQ